MILVMTINIEMKITFEDCHNVFLDKFCHFLEKIMGKIVDFILFLSSVNWTNLV
jgi:hypothetical protein